MHVQTVFLFTGIAFVAKVSPGPAVLLAFRNAMTFGVKSVFWSKQDCGQASRLESRAGSNWR
jgi:threonine/homoserine/homoserine lactone efflux protein